jgi:ribosomal peptide maturation radical SAM protein 1
MDAARLARTAITAADANQRTNLRVALVNMPFHSTRYPSIALGLLHAGLMELGYHVRTANIALQFAARLGWEEYEIIASDRWRFAGEWMFARAAFGEDAPNGERWLGDGTDADLLCGALDRDTNWLLEVREQVAPSFIDECLGLLPWREYDVVGFGSMFQQNCAALALARRLKELCPALITVFGGANLEGEMGIELVRAMPMVDYAVIGEGDEVLPALLERLEADEQEVDLPGVARRGVGGDVVYSSAVQQVRDLDTLPDPNYDDYFAAVETTAMPGVVRDEAVYLPYESTRGCWWGLKHHCTFCGIANLDTSYRRKSPVRVLAGIDGLVRRYGLYNLLCVDSIMDMRYVNEVFEPLAAQRKDYHFFAEVKANLTREQLRTLRRAGVTALQPGIESMSTRLLQLMRKGVTGIQNVRLLKWCEYYGIRPAWNILTGFPGETAEDYARQLDVLRLIPHLQPPGSCGPIKLNRFSPFFDAPQAWGITDVRPDPAYAHIYPAHVDLDRVAYEFDHAAPTALPIEAHQELAAYVRWWHQARLSPQRPYLHFLRGAGQMTVTDGRDPEAPIVRHFGELQARVYEVCTETYHRVPQIEDEVRATGLPDLSTPQIERALAELGETGLVLEEDGGYLALALPMNPNW